MTSESLQESLASLNEELAFDLLDNIIATVKMIEFNSHGNDNIQFDVGENLNPKGITHQIVLEAKEVNLHMKIALF